MSKPRLTLITLLSLIFVLLASPIARAEEEVPEPAPAVDPPPAAAVEAPAAAAEAPAAAVEAPAAAEVEAPSAAVEAPAAAEAEAPSAAVETPASEFDADGDGVMEPDEKALAAEAAAAFQDVPAEVTDTELDKRPDGAEMVPSLTAEKFRAMVKVARAKVLDRLQAKMQRSSDATMRKLSYAIFFVSLGGFLLLGIPFVMRKRAPMGTLFKYSALAAVTFFVTVNLFGAVVVGFRGAQRALGSATNPQLRVASGFFDSLDHNAEDLLVTGKELFAPTLAQLQGNSDEQPVVALLENGRRIVKDAQVFVTVAKVFKKLDFVFALLPTVLLLVTMVLFVLAIKPTLVEIIRLPLAAATGQGEGSRVVGGAFRRIRGELLATLCTLGVLVLLTLLSGAILGFVVRPALDALIAYFSLGVSYLQFVDGASSGLVFLMLFSVIVFLVLNLAAVIASMSLFLGKSQKIFQRRFNAGVPIGAHRPFWKWAVPSVLVAQLVPWLYLALARWGLDALNERLTSGITDADSIPWTAIMLVGPLLLVLGFVLVFWAARGFKALGFLARYKPATVPAAADPS